MHVFSKRRHHALDVLWNLMLVPNRQIVSHPAHPHVHLRRVVGKEFGRVSGSLGIIHRKSKDSIELSSCTCPNKLPVGP